MMHPLSPYVSTDPAAYAPAVVALEGDESRGAFDALVLLGQRWNGWACPVFPLSAVVLMREQLGLDGSDPDAEALEITEGPDGARVIAYGDGEPCEQEPITLDGTRYWPIGTGGWVWLEISADDDDDDDDES